MFVAGSQASHAKRSVILPERHEEAALMASRKTADANERAAAPLEEANAVTREVPAKPHWQITTIDKNRYRVENQGPDAAYDVGVAIPDYPSRLVRIFERPKARLDEDLAVSLLLMRAIGTPMDPTLAITWREADSREVLTVKTTLSG